MNCECGHLKESHISMRGFCFAWSYENGEDGKAKSCPCQEFVARGRR